MRAMSSLVVAPATAERVPAECLRSWNRRPGTPTARVAGSQVRRRKFDRRIGPPSGAGNTRPSGPGAPRCSRWLASSSRRKADRTTVLRPASVLGGPMSRRPFTSVRISATVTVRCRRSTRRRLRPPSSPQQVMPGRSVDPLAAGLIGLHLGKRPVGVDSRSNVCDRSYRPARGSEPANGPRFSTCAIRSTFSPVVPRQPL